jgi:hypothetical protein
MLDKKAQVQLRRRYMLVGTTLDSMRIFDIIEAVKTLPEVTLEAEGDMAVNALFASLFTDKIKTLRLKNLPATLDKSGPDYLNLLRILDIREALTLAGEHTNIELLDSKADANYVRSVAKTLGWKTFVQ